MAPQKITARDNVCIKAFLITSICSIVKLLITSIGNFTYAQNLLYMLYFVSCKLYLFLEEVSVRDETRQMRNKRKSLQLQEVFLCAAHQSLLKKFAKKIKLKQLKKCKFFVYSKITFYQSKKLPLKKEHHRKTKPRSPLQKSRLKRYLEFLKRIMG